MYEVELHIAGTEIPVGYAMLEKLTELLPDEPGYEHMYQRLALVGTTKVQEVIAGRENIDLKTVHILLRSRQSNVLQPLLCNPRAKEAMTQIEALRLANSNQPEVLSTLSWNIGEFSLCEPVQILERFAADSDPWIRALVMDCDEAPEELLERLSLDQDPDVQRAAEKTLEERHVDLLKGTE